MNRGDEVPSDRALLELLLTEQATQGLCPHQRLELELLLRRSEGRDDRLGFERAATAIDLWLAGADGSRLANELPPSVDARLTELAERYVSSWSLPTSVLRPDAAGDGSEACSVRSGGGSTSSRAR